MDKNPVRRLLAVTLLLGLYGCGQKYRDVHTPPPSDSEVVLVNSSENPVVVVVDSNAVSPYTAAPLASPKNYFEVQGDYLFWQATQGGMDYGINATKESAGDTVTTKGNVKDVGEKWSSGFRVGLGFQRENAWNLKATWTSFHNHSHRSAKATNPDLVYSDVDGEVFYPSWAPNLMGIALAGSSSWTLKYNTVDLDFGRAYCKNKTVSVQLHAGLRGADIKQNLNVTYTTINHGVDPGLPNMGLENQSTVKGKNNFMGLGLRAGTDLCWNWTKHWGLFGKLSASLVYGEFKVQEKVHSLPNTQIGDDQFFQNATMRHHFQALQPNLEAALGLKWNTDLCKGKQNIAIGVGYEVVEWFNQNQFFTLNSTGNTGTVPTTFSQVSRNGNLNIQGVNVSLQYAF